MFSSSARAAAGAAALWAALGAGASDVGAVEPWLRFRGSERCSVPAEALALRIRETTIGTPNPELGVEVTLSRGVRTTARVRLVLGSRTIGTKELEARTCDEMLDAITTVVALALTSESEETTVTGATAPSRTELQREGQDERREALAELRGSPESVALPEHTRQAPRPPADALAAHGERGPDASRWRALFGVGADRGSLRDATLVVRAGAAAGLGGGELRAVASYGVPSVREEVSDVLRSVHADFGAVALDYCHGLDAQRWVSACAGLELVLRRYSRVDAAPEEPRIETELFEPSTSLLAGLAFVYRDATVQPQLDVTAQRALLGALADAPPLGFRAALGAAVQF
jgi:hypothetical protein